MMIFMTLVGFAFMAFIVFMILDKRRKRLEYGDDDEDEEKRKIKKLLIVLFD